MFSREDYANLVTFLSRVQITGQEAPALVRLFGKIDAAGRAAPTEAELQAKAQQKEVAPPVPNVPPVDTALPEDESD